MTLGQGSQPHGLQYYVDPLSEIKAWCMCVPAVLFSHAHGPSMFFITYGLWAAKSLVASSTSKKKTPKL